MSSFSPTLLTAFYAQHLKNYDADYIFPSRTVKDYELAYLISDDHCHLALDNHHYMSKGDCVVFRRPGQFNQSYMPYESILLCFQVEGEDMEAFLEGLPSLFQSDQVHGLRQIFEDVYKEFLSNRPFASIYHSAKLSEIIYTLYQDTHSYANLHDTHITNPHLLTSLKYIDQSLDRPFTIQTMSQDLSLSQRHIYHLFKEHLDTTPIAYINDCRLNQAKQHLHNSNLPIHQIAQLCGYENVTYFITLFRKTYGITPAKFRKFQTSHK